MLAKSPLSLLPLEPAFDDGAELSHSSLTLGSHGTRGSHSSDANAKQPINANGDPTSPRASHGF